MKPEIKVETDFQNDYQDRMSIFEQIEDIEEKDLVAAYHYGRDHTGVQRGDYRHGRATITEGMLDAEADIVEGILIGKDEIIAEVRGEYEEIDITELRKLHKLISVQDSVTYITSEFISVDLDDKLQ